MDFSFLILDTRTKGNRHRSWKPVLIIERDAKIFVYAFSGCEIVFPGISRRFSWPTTIPETK